MKRKLFLFVIMLGAIAFAHGADSSVPCLGESPVSRPSYYQALVGIDYAEPISWDEEGNPIYDKDFAFQSEKDGRWYQKRYEWVFGDPTQYVEPEFRQVEAGVCEVWVVDYGYSEDGESIAPIWPEHSFTSEKDGRRYVREYYWEMVPQGGTIDDPRFVQQLYGYRDAEPLYQIGNYWTNVYASAAFVSDLDGRRYEPDYEWVRYEEWMEDAEEPEYKQILDGYREAEPARYEPMFDEWGEYLGYQPVYSPAVFRSEKDGKLYEPCYSWGMPFPYDRIIEIASVEPTRPGWETSVVSVVCYSNIQFKIIVDEPHSENIRYEWNVGGVSNGVGRVAQTGPENTFLFSPPEGSEGCLFEVYCLLSDATDNSAWRTCRWKAYVPRAIYVSESSLATTPDGRNWTSAYHDIQEAVDVAHDDDTIVVGPGKYLPVSVAVERLNIESVEGAERTIIEAEPYSGNSYSSTGGGSCFRACANYDPWSTGEGYYVDYGRQIGQGVRLDGFTLRHGFAKSNSYAMQYGGGVFGGVVSNCILEDNYGTSGGGACRATLENCIIRNNRGVYGTGVMSCVLRHCTVVNNRHSGEGLLYATECVEDEGVAVAGSSTIEDSIVVNNFDATGGENNYYYGGTVISTSGNSYSTIQVVVSNTVVKSSCTRPLAFGSGNIAEDPCLVDCESGDCRLRSGSPCIVRGMGAVPYDNEFDAIAKASGASKLHWAADAAWRAEDGMVVVGNVGDGRAAVVDAVAEGSGWLRFDWKCDSASGRDRINFYVDGVGTRALPGASDWQTAVLRVEGGQSHKFAWKLIKAKSGAADDDGAYVRNVEWVADIERLDVGYALGHPEWRWVSDGWRVAQDGDVEGGYYLESLLLGDDSAALLSTKVEGPAELAFSWKVSSEADYDYLDFFIDGELVAWVDGEQEWDMVSFELTNGVHELKWVYSKDETEAAGYDRAWIRDVLFKNTTFETPVEVPYSWLNSYPKLMTIAKGDYEAAAAMSVVKVSSGGSASVCIPVWQNYVAGIDPTDSNDVFTATISVSEGVPHVSYTPDLGDARIYKTWGKKFLVEETWMKVPPGTEAAYNFFKVTVEMK